MAPKSRFEHLNTNGKIVEYDLKSNNFLLTFLQVNFSSLRKGEEFFFVESYWNKNLMSFSTFKNLITGYSVQSGVLVCL